MNSGRACCFQQNDGNAFNLAMLFCFGISAEEAIGILEERIGLLNGEIKKLEKARILQVIYPDCRTFFPAVTP